MRSSLLQLHLLPSPSFSYYLFSAHLNTLNYSRCCQKIAWGQRQLRGVGGRGNIQQPIHLPLTCHMPHRTRLCGTPININLSIKVIHYVALPHATRGNASSTCLATSSPALTWLPVQYLLYFCGLPTSTNNKIFLGWAIKSLLLIAEGTNDLASA